MNLSIQDLLAIWGPIGALMGFMWHHSNTRFEKLDEKIDGVEKRLDEKISSIEKRLGEKIDAVRDRVSRIEGQLAPASIVAFNPPRRKEAARATHSS
jgi:hypothetical protein